MRIIQPAAADRSGDPASLRHARVRSADLTNAVRVLAEATPPGSLVAVPRDWLLDLLGTPVDQIANADLTIADLCARYNRDPPTIRGWLAAGRFPGAYRFQNREWRVPSGGLAAFEAYERARPIPPRRPIPHAAPSLPITQPRPAARDQPSTRREGPDADFDPDAKAKARAMFMEGRPPREIAVKVARSLATIYAWSSRGRWRVHRTALRREHKETRSARSPEPIAADLPRPHDKAEDTARVLFVEEGMPSREIAVAVGRSVGTIYSWANRGRWRVHREALLRQHREALRQAPRSTSATPPAIVADAIRAITAAPRSSAPNRPTEADEARASDPALSGTWMA